MRHEVSRKTKKKYQLTQSYVTCGADVSSLMRCVDRQIITDVSKDRSAIHLQGQTVQEISCVI